MSIFKRHKQTAPKRYTTPAGSAPRLYVDILNQPHTLIAGTTGSGKSCAINGIMYTALYKLPSQAIFVLIDPKYTELSIYKNLPHTFAYCTDPADAFEVLNSMISIINARYQDATAAGLRKSNAPDIYILIDELSDLIFSEPRTIQTLGKIARIGRAANVHLIAATQCPNRKTLSAEFAANCSARLGLRCRDKIESRQIIGTGDAVTLPQYGYAYYVAPQYMTPQLVNIPYYTDDILSERVQYWERQK